MIAAIYARKSTEQTGIEGHMTDSAPASGRRRVISGELLDIATASQLLGCSQKALRARVARRIVPFRKLGGRIVFRRAELEEFIDGLPGVTVAQAQANLAARHN